MTIRECYEKLHGDFEGSCRRLINERMVTRFVLKFPDDESMQLLRNAVVAKDIESSFRSVHTLKGVAANLGFTDLYSAAWNLTEQLRPRQQEADAELLDVLEKEYARTIDILKEFAENQG